MNGCKRILKKCWMPLAILMITMAVLFCLFRALTPWAKQYKGEVEKHLSAIVGQPVAINSMETSWYWFEPVLRLNQVTVSDSQDHVLKFNKLLVGINLLSSIWHWHIQPGILYVDDAHLTLRQANNHWQIDGLSHDKQVTIEPDLYLPVLGWLLGQQKIIIKNVSAMVHLANGSIVPLSDLNLTAVNRNGHYRLKGRAKLAQTMATELLIMADMTINPYTFNDATGEAYFSVNRLLPAQWQVFFPESPYKLESGKGNLEAWLDFSKGHFSGLQTRLNFHRIAWSKQGAKHSSFIQSLKGNFAWNTSNEGWKLSGDHIQLVARGMQWPENAIQIKHNKEQQSYQVFLQNLQIEPLLTAEIDWPELMQPVLALHPSGQLKDTQLEVKEGKVDYVLTRFTDLSWKSQAKIPAVSNLAGVLSWQPTEGRLELDGENTSLAFTGRPPITFKQANAALEWKDLSQGLRISMDRLVLTHEDFVISARGVLDEALSATRQLRLAAEFSAEKAQQWFAYIPPGLLKAKLDDWIKHDIKFIDKASGQLSINGMLADFPFDNKPGEFKIVSRFSGVDLFFNRHWPISRDIDAYLHVDKRDLDVEVLQADLQGITVDHANFNVANIGLDKETLLFHGKIEAPAPKVMDYVLASPLQKHLAKLKMLDIQGNLGLDLSIEVPLYPENDEVLARGDLTFTDDQLLFHHSLKDVQLLNLSGPLQFDEHGVTDSALSATLNGEPLAIHIQTKSLPKPHTEVNLVGNTSINLLRENFDLPIMPFLQGELKVESQIILADDANASDHIHVGSNLQGVAIDLPAPFGKTATETAAISFDVDLNQQKTLRLRSNYDNRCSSDLWFNRTKEGFALDKGEVRLGNGQALWRKNSGVQLVGSLATVDVKQWREVFAKVQANAETKAPLLAKMSAVDVKLGRVILWGQNYPAVAINATKEDDEEWSISLEQSDIAGDLHYQFSTNTLSGHFERLFLDNSALVGKTATLTTTKLKPKDIPNLNLTVDDFRLEDVPIGNIDIKSTSKESKWVLDSCKIKTPEYQLTMKGDWQQQGQQNITHMQADLQTSDLGKSLQRWHITPAVEAHKANIQFDGSWPGALNEFALAKTNGRVYITLQNGRITHLSPETEEKLGVGKLLSILSLQTIPRRLKLDFSDLSQDGYSYDVFKGNFTLKKGVMNTTDSYIDGPVAYASMKGDLDLVKQLYDVELHVLPHITASLPVVATIAGGPIAGMATWVASKIINQGMEKVTGYTYRVSGPWSDPVVQQVSILRK